MEFNLHALHMTEMPQNTCTKWRGKKKVRRRRRRRNYFDIVKFQNHSDQKWLVCNANGS
jgi:hypothetical protein